MKFSYKGTVYEGSEIWEGLEVIEKDRVNPDIPFKEKYRAITLVNSWYADKTTQIKPKNITHNVLNLGLEKIYETNGIGRVWFNGHNPQNKLASLGVRSVVKQGSRVLVTTDKGMSWKKYNDMGGYISVSADGIIPRGFNGPDFSEIVDNPPTMKLKKDAEGKYSIGEIWENEAVTREELLDIAEAQLEEDIAQLEAASSPAQQVLVIDDEVLMRILIKKILEKQGYEIIEASSGEEGLTKMSKNIGLVITDRWMDGMGGDETAKEIKKKFPGVPVVMATGALPEDGEKIEGVDATLGKPFTPDGLREIVKKHLKTPEPDDIKTKERKSSSPIFSVTSSLIKKRIKSNKERISSLDLYLSGQRQEMQLDPAFGKRKRMKNEQARLKRLGGHLKLWKSEDSLREIQRDVTRRIISIEKRLLEIGPRLKYYEEIGSWKSNMFSRETEELKVEHERLRNFKALLIKRDAEGMWNMLKGRARITSDKEAQRLLKPTKKTVEIAGRLFYLEITRDSRSASSPVGDQVAGQGLQPSVDNLQSNKYGGINLNPALLDLQIKRDANFVPLPMNLQPIENMYIEGFIPVIINVTPVVNLPLLLGLTDTEAPFDSADADAQKTPFDLSFVDKYREKYLRGYEKENVDA